MLINRVYWSILIQFAISFQICGHIVQRASRFSRGLDGYDGCMLPKPALKTKCLVISSFKLPVIFSLKRIIKCIAIRFIPFQNQSGRVANMFIRSALWLSLTKVHK